MPSKTVFIVYDKNTEEFANYLNQLISTKCVPQSGEPLHATLWSDKQYKDNLPKMVSNNHIVILGGTKLIKANKLGMGKKFSNYGMEYGWLGTIAVLETSTDRLERSEVTKFKEMAKKDSKELQELFEQKKSLLGAAALACCTTSLHFTTSMFSNFFDKVHQLVKFFFNKGDYWRERETALILHFYLNDLNKFMEE